MCDRVNNPLCHSVVADQVFLIELELEFGGLVTIRKSISPPHFICKASIYLVMQECRNQNTSPPSNIKIVPYNFFVDSSQITWTRIIRVFKPKPGVFMTKHSTLRLVCTI